MLFSAPFDSVSPRQYRIAFAEQFSELSAVEIGYNRTPAGLRQTLKRDVYILHYITRGRGEFCGKPFSAGDGYVVVPYESETVIADESDPYEAYWVMFRGSKAAELLRTCELPCHNRVFTCSKTRECAEILRKVLFDMQPVNEWEEAETMNAALHRVLARHFSTVERLDSTVGEDLPQRVMRFIQQNYHRQFSIQSMAHSLHYSRNYVYTQFKERYGVSVQKYLSSLRMEKAKELLSQSGPVTVSEVASSVGYTDALYFSRVFHQSTGTSPTEFAKAAGDKAKLPPDP